MTFGDEWGWGSPKAEAQKVYETYARQRNFMTRRILHIMATSENSWGVMQGHRESVVLATKYSNAAPGSDRIAGNHRKKHDAGSGSQLKRLQTTTSTVLGAHLGRDHACGRIMRGLDDWFARQGSLRRHLRMLPLVIGSGKYSGGA